MQRPVPRWILDTPIAHRGLHAAAAGVPENSLPAFAAAAVAGYPIELDVRVTRDGFAVVIHDADLLRVAGRPDAVADVDCKELQEFGLGDTEERIPALSGVFNAVAGRVPILVEVKNEGIVGDVEAATLEAIDAYDGPVAVQSFNPLTLQWFAHQAPQLARGLLAGDFRDIDMRDELREKLKNLEFAGIADPDFIGYDVRLLPNDAVDRMRAAGLPVLGWTVRSSDEAARAREVCDNIIFEGFRP